MRNSSFARRMPAQTRSPVKMACRQRRYTWVCIRGGLNRIRLAAANNRDGGGCRLWIGQYAARLPNLAIIGAVGRGAWAGQAGHGGNMQHFGDKAVEIVRVLRWWCCSPGCWLRASAAHNRCWLLFHWMPVRFAAILLWRQSPLHQGHSPARR